MLEKKSRLPMHAKYDSWRSKQSQLFSLYNSYSFRNKFTQNKCISWRHASIHCHALGCTQVCMSVSAKQKLQKDWIV